MAQPAERQGQGAKYIGEPSCFRKRQSFRSDRQYGEAHRHL